MNPNLILEAWISISEEETNIGAAGGQGEGILFTDF